MKKGVALTQKCSFRRITPKCTWPLSRPRITRSCLITPYSLRSEYRSSVNHNPTDFNPACPFSRSFFSGSRIGFSALVILDRPRVVELASLSARSPSGNCAARSALFQAFCAACVLLHDIRKDTLQILENKHQSSELKDQLKRNIPHVQKIPRWPPISDGKSKLAFQISAVAFQNESDWNETRFLYPARTNDAKTKDETDVVVVKFTRQYCPELHSFCAKQGRAPKLLGYGTVPGGWKVVVM